MLTGFRLFFFLNFRSDGISFGDFWPALVMGARVDAKWLAILLLPAWVAAVLTMPWKKGRPAVRWLSGLALFLAVAAGLLNTGFYAFYGTPGLFHRLRALSGRHDGDPEDDRRRLARRDVPAHGGSLLCVSLGCAAAFRPLAPGSGGRFPEDEL